MAGLMDKIRGRDSTTTGVESGADSTMSNTASNELGSTSMGSGSGIGHHHGSSSTGQYGSSGMSAGTTEGTSGGLMQEAYDGITNIQHEARVRFTGQPTTTNVTSQSSANTVEIPAQTVTSTLPAKRVVVEVPERQVEVNLPARHVQLENNPEIEVHTRPSIRGVASEIMSEVTGGHLGHKQGAIGSSGIPSATGGSSDPSLSTGKY